MIDQTQGSTEDHKPLTSWAKEPSLRDLKQNLEDAKPIHEAQKGKINEWLDNLNVTGKAKVKTPAGNSAIVPKLIRRQAEWRYSALSEPFLSTDDLFNVKPVTWEDREAAQQNQLLLNHQVNTSLDKTNFIDEYVRAAVDEGTVIVRVGWEFEEESYQAREPIVEYHVNPAFAPTHEFIDQLKQNSPSQYATDVPDELKQAHDLSLERGMPLEPKILGYRDVTKTRVIKNQPTAEVCDYRNVIFDPTCKGDLDKASFLGYTFESSKAELEKEGESDEGSQNFNFNDDARKKFVVHEYWGFMDVDDSGVLKPIVAAWVGSTLIRMEENPFPDKKIPFVVAQYLPVRRSVYGEPDGALLEDNQKVIGAVTRGMIDIMGKSANGQTGIRRDMLDATNRRKYEKGQDYEFNVNVDPRQGVFMHTFPEIPASAQFMLQLQNQEAESLTGVKSYSSGVSGASLGDVAAGVRGALDAASKRELGILRRLSNGIVKIGRKVISMNSEFLSEEEGVRVTNDTFVTVRRDDLTGNFDLKLAISTAEEDNNKAEQLAFMLQTVGPQEDPTVRRMILGDICRLRKMPDLAKKLGDYEPQPDPLMQEKLQLEVELLRAQIARENGLASQSQATAQLNSAKTNTEAAKAENISANTDQQNLDFVEQESGVKQERDIQMRGEQARSQAQLKLMDQESKREGHQVDLVKEYIKKKSA